MFGVMVAIVKGLSTPSVRAVRRAVVSMADYLMSEFLGSKLKAGPACKY